jgi:D-glycero-D-manno-heptose 1,7-bisphosphate phosphatase
MTLSIGRYVSPGRVVSGRPALFCDRDGVLNRRVPGGYVTAPVQVEVLGIALPALRAATHLGMTVVMVTNQGAIGRRLATSEEVLLVNATLLTQLSSVGIRIDAVYVCPHHPDAADVSDRDCRCRKPAPGLFLAAADDLGIDLARSVAIGDQPSDREAAISAGIPAERMVLVADDDDPGEVATRVCNAFGWGMQADS